MNAVLWWLGQNALTVAVLTPVVLLVGRLFRDRPAVRHALWLVVLLKFVTPPIVAWPWTLDEVRESFRPTPSPDMAELPSTPPVVEAGPAGLSGPLPPPLPAAPPQWPDTETGPAEPVAPAVEDGPDWAAVAGWCVVGVWLVGMVGCAAWQARRLAGHAAFVRRGAAAPPPLTAEVQGVARRLGVRPPPALVARGIRSPFVWCLGRLRLIWPECLADRGAVARARGVLAHELAHVRRGDHWVAWLELVAGVVWWWNPLFWYVRRRVRESAEMACDALALGAYPDGRRDYAEMLLELSAGLKSGVPAHVLAVSAGTPSSFERRLSMILSAHPSGKVSVRGVAAALLLAAVVLPGWSLGQAPPLPPPDDPPKSAADDPVLRDLIEQGKFAEAKARLEAVRAKLAADGAFSDRWTTLLRKELPEACVRGLPKDAPLSWQTCLGCHAGPPKDKLTPVEPKLWVIDKRPTSYVPDGTPVPWYQPVADGAMLTFPGAGRLYAVTFDARGAALHALDTETGKQVWRAQLAGTPPARGAEDKWAFSERADGKTLTLTWTRPAGRTQFTLDRATGQVIELDKPASQNVPRKAAGTPSPDGKLLATANDREAVLIDAASGKVVRTILLDGPKVAGLSFSPDGKLLHLRGADGSIQEVDVATGKVLRTMPAKADPSVPPPIPTGNTPGANRAPPARNGKSNYEPARGADEPARNFQPPAGGREMNVLDLGERYLRATADVKKARNRLDHLDQAPGVATQREATDARIELEEAGQRVQLIARFIRDALQAAKAEAEAARAEADRTADLVKKGYAGSSQMEVARSRAAEAVARVNQLEAILSAAGAAPGKSPGPGM